MVCSDLNQWTTLYDAHTEIACLMLGSMTPELHRQFELYYPFDMIQELRSMFEKQAGVKKFDLIQSFHACKQEEGKPVGWIYVLKMKGYVGETGTSWLCNKKSLNAKGKNKVKGKGKDKKDYIPKPKNPKPTAMERPAKDDACHHCKEGFMIERKLKQGALYLYVGNGVRAQVEAIGSFDLVLPNGLVICLDNCHYAPTITRGVVSVSRLVDNGFVQCFTDYGISVSKNGVLYFNAVSRNGIYEIDMHDLVPNVNYIYNVSNKRVKHNLDSTYLWHCRLAHINKKLIKQLQQDGLLKSTDDESFDKMRNLVLSGKMTKKTFSSYQEISGRAVDLEEIQEEEDTTPSEITSNIPQEVEGFEPPQKEVIPICRSERTHRASNRLCLNVEVEEHSLGDLNEPTSYKAAMLDLESNKWIDAMNAEIQSMMDNMVWVLVDLPPGCKTVGSKWLFKKKTDMNGIVHVYKARLVAKGYTQLYGVDYEETFSPVADIRAIRILISIAAYYDYEIWQMDVKTTFLNGYLDEDIYMVQPEASRSWNKRFDEEIKRFGFAQNLDEPCVYQKASRSNVTFLILYVDDIIIMGNHIPSLRSVKDYLGKYFAMKDLGEATFILGIKIYRDRSKRLIGLCQNAYMDKILKRYKMDNSKRGHIPMQERLDLNKSQGAQTPKEVNRMKNVPYASVVGSIVYAVRCTRLDVAFAQNLTSRFQQNPGELHWTAVKNILKYLRNTKDMFLVYGGNPSTELRVECYCDAEFETDRDDTKSQTGYVFILNGGATDWKSFKQSTTAMSVTESEYIAASEATMEAVWIRKFISGLGIVPTINEPLNMYCDNSAEFIMLMNREFRKAPDTIKDDIIIFAITSVVVVRPVNTRHRWDETCLLDIIVIKSTDVVGMALPVQNINHSAFRSMFEKEKLSGNNFNDWFARLKLVLRVEKKMHVIEQPLPPAPEAGAEPNIVAQWTALYDAHTEIACLMLGSMTPELHRQFELHYPYDMIQELRSMFEKQAGVEKFDLIQSFHACKQEEGKSVADYVLKMKGYVEQLERLGYMLPQDISVGLILNGLTKDFVGFVRNYNMHNMGKTIGEIHAMLIEYEKGLPKKAETPQVMMIKSGKIQKANKKSLNAKGKNKVKGRGKDKKLLKKKKQVGSASSLDNCHYAPIITRGVVSVSRLIDNGFVQCFTNYEILVSKNDVLYFNAIARNGIYEIDMHDLVPNVNSIYNVSNKRVKHNLDSTYLWHCRLAHINKKRIKQLQQDGLLKSTDDESFDKCESCLSGKMTKKPFPHSNERAKDLLGIIHTDVCGPLRHVSRQGASYFITFTDDYSRYGYVYLLKHKHEIAIESATCILNMVLTKKVDKTPYELWYGKVPNLSYLKVWGCEALVKRDTPNKLEQRSVKCIFIGYPKKTMGYYFYFPPENKIVVARYVEFFEKFSHNVKQISGRAAAMLDPESKKWVDAMNAEMQSMMDDMIWVLVDLPPNSIRILISIAAFNDHEIWQMDVKTSFLNGYLDEDIYMVQREGFVDPKHPRKVCKLQRSIYGFNQASRSSNKRFDTEIKKFGFAQNLDEPYVYQKASGSNVTFLILYVDDIIIMDSEYIVASEAAMELFG
ncbi:retrotransposon protein, putative, ty1-copia subclass [Tanacetum coccineum]